MRVTLLGGGLAALSLAYFLQDRPDIEHIDILEKESRPGGLCRSFTHDGIAFDVGPHIIFSKDTEILDFMNGLLGENIARHRRSNVILHKDSVLQYPFENDLSQLPKDDLQKCVNGFLQNPYRHYDASNMLQFFLKIFGEGITNLYLRPYNEKIWKFDPSYMNTQMVDRIPRPPDEDILRSANGETVDGYTHQLYFTYPKKQGIEALILALIAKLNVKVSVHTNAAVRTLEKDKTAQWRIVTDAGEFCADRVVSCMPLPSLIRALSAPDEIQQHADALQYNGIAIGVFTWPKRPEKDNDHFAFMVAEKRIVFHRLSNLAFLGQAYGKERNVYMCEVTYRQGDLIDVMPDSELTGQMIEGLAALGFIENPNAVASTLLRFPHAYVIYDIDHARHTGALRRYAASLDIALNGRFGNFEYLNMDAVIRQSKTLAEAW